MKQIDDFNLDVANYNEKVEQFSGVVKKAKESKKFVVKDFDKPTNDFIGFQPKLETDMSKFILRQPDLDISNDQLDKLSRAVSSGAKANVNALDVKKPYVKQLEEYTQFNAATKGTGSVYRAPGGGYVPVLGAKISQVPNRVVDTPIASQYLSIEKFKNENTVLSEIDRNNLNIQTPSKKEYDKLEPSMKDRILFVDDIDKQIQKDRLDSYKQRIESLPDSEKIVMPVVGSSLPVYKEQKALKGLTNIYEAEGIVSQKPLVAAVAIAGAAYVAPLVFAKAAAVAGAWGLSAGALKTGGLILGASGWFCCRCSNFRES